MPGEVHRSSSVHLAAGGEGMNVARSAVSLGDSVVVVGMLGSHTGELVAALADAEQIDRSCCGAARRPERA